jgi:hypothetical protein
MMKSSTAPRRVYAHKGLLLVSIAGEFFSPGKQESEITIDKEVKIEVVEGSRGKKRVTVTQRHGKNPPVVETWTSTEVEFTPRTRAA